MRAKRGHAARQRAYRQRQSQRKVMAADPVVAYLKLVIETNTSIRSTLRAETILARLHVVTESRLARMARVFGVTPSYAAEDATPAIVAQRKALAAAHAKLAAGTASAAEVNLGTHIAGLLLKPAEHVDQHKLAVAVGYMLSGAGNPPPCAHYPDPGGFAIAHMSLDWPGRIAAAKAHAAECPDLSGDAGDDDDDEAPSGLEPRDIP